MHRVDRIINNVGPDLVEFAPERIHQKRNPLVIALHHHALFQLVIQDGQGDFQALHDVHVLRRRLVHVGVFLDRVDQVRNARGAALDFMQ